MEWWNEAKPEVIGSEIRMYHKLLRYGGTGDLLAIINDKRVLIDYKSTYVVSDMTCRVQLEAYAQALASHGFKIDEKMILHLKKDGTAVPKTYPANDAEAWRVFGSLKCVYDYLQSWMRKTQKKLQMLIAQKAVCRESLKLRSFKMQTLTSIVTMY